MSTARIELPPKLIPVFMGPARYRGAYGGRGSGKTRSFALMTAVRAYQMCEAGESGAVLCGREFMNSLEDSSMEEIKQAIRSVDWLNAYFDIGEKYIRTRCRRISYVFCGLRHNLDSIKSKARVLLAWVDEAENVSEAAWRKLGPTVRENDSEIWVTWNREEPGSATDQRYILDPPDNAKIVELNHSDNPWFPEVLEQERLNDLRRMTPEMYAHVWEGAYLERSEAQVFGGKYRIAEFTPGLKWGMPYHGLDFGFAQDPTAAVKCWIVANTLYIEYEAGKVGLELDHTKYYICQRIEGFNAHEIQADSARPESISYLRRHGLPKIKGVVKGKGSVEDGIAFMHKFDEIVIHPRCTQTAKEFRLYSYKVDNSGRVTNEIVDANNHYIDAIRYAISKAIRSKGTNKPATAGNRTF